MSGYIGIVVNIMNGHSVDWTYNYYILELFNWLCKFSTTLSN